MSNTDQGTVKLNHGLTRKWIYWISQEGATWFRLLRNASSGCTKTVRNQTQACACPVPARQQLPNVIKQKGYLIKFQLIVIVNGSTTVYNGSTTTFVSFFFFFPSKYIHYLKPLKK